MNFEFATAGRIVFGPGTLAQAGPAAAALGRHAFVVTGRSAARAQPLLDLLVQHGLAATRFVVAGQEAGIFAKEDPRQLILSVLGIHFLPFAITGLVEKMVHAPVDPTFLVERQKWARLHVRGVMLARSAKAALEGSPEEPGPPQPEPDAAGGEGGATA